VSTLIADRLLDELERATRAAVTLRAEVEFERGRRAEESTLASRNEHAYRRLLSEREPMTPPWRMMTRQFSLPQVRRPSESNGVSVQSDQQHQPTRLCGVNCTHVLDAQLWQSAVDGWHDLRLGTGITSLTRTVRKPSGQP
jgi:hypothetical protein